MSSDEEFELEDEPAADGAGRACGAGEEDANSVGGKASEVSGDYASSSEDDGSAGSDEFVPNGDDESEDDDASYHTDDSDEERRRAAPGRKKPTQKRKAGRQKKNGKRRRKGKKRPRGVSEDAFIDTSDDDESDGNASYEPDDSDEEQSIPRRRREGARQCTARTNEKMSQVLREEKRTERDALGDAVPGEDKQYLHSTASDDDDDGGKVRSAKRAPSCKPKARKLRRMHSDEDVGSNLGSAFDEASNGSGRDTSENAALQIKPTHFQANHSSALKQKTVNCPSEKDALTKLNLPKTNAHVCCLLKDGTRFCYTLNTMQRIAIAKNCKKNGRLQFMQPPEFTSPMDGDMIDRIQYLFGRDALFIEDSSVYKEMMQRGGDRSNFLDYVNDLKGCPDLCCCPLCYNEAYRRQGNLIGKSLRATSDSEGESEEEEWSDSDNSDAARRIEESEEDPYTFLDDPMTILQNVGLEKAATFCFRLLSSLKDHIKAVHGFDPSVMKGNGLFHRFQIRSADGLLQHWLPIRYEEIWEGKGVSDPKYYRRYWRKHGNSGPFRDLYNIIDKAWLRGEQSGDYASDFSSSLSHAKEDWQRLIAPYLKSRRKDDIKDMIDDRSVHEAAGPRPMLEEDKSDLEEKFAAHLHKKNEEMGNDDESSEELSKRASSQAGSSSEGSGSDSQSESEEEDAEEDEGEEEAKEEDPVDEWMKEKMQRPTAARMRKRDDDSEDDSLFGSQPKKNVVTPGVLFESDEDDD